MFKSLRSRVVISYFLVVILSLVLASVFFVVFLSGYSKEKDRSNLERQVEALSGDITRLTERFNSLMDSPDLKDNQNPERRLDALAYVRLIKGTLDSQSQVMNTKLFITDTRGNVLVESAGGVPLGSRKIDIEYDSEKGEVVAETMVFMPTGKESLMVISPTSLEYDTSGYLVGVKPVQELGSIASLGWYVTAAGAIALLISMVFGIYLSWAVIHPVKEITNATRKMAEGDYSQEVDVKGPEETAELARDFNEMAKRVRVTHELLENFVGDVSHELRTPLTSIEGFSQALLDGMYENEEERRHYLEIINNESKRLFRIINDLLLLSRIDAGELHLEKEQFDMAGLLRKVEGGFRLKAEEKGINLELNLPKKQVELSTDPVRLEQILTNVMDNALKYSPYGSTVVISAAVEVGTATIAIKDNGEGINPEALPKIFDRFYRIEKSRATKHGGAGLGLSICRELIETIGGSIEVESKVGEGSTFTIKLPY